MKVTVENAGPCRKKLSITVPVEKVKEEYDAVVNAFAGQARIPGFRQGKAPRNLVEKRFSKDIAQEVKDRLIPMGYHHALKQENLAPVSVLSVDDLAFTSSQPMSFSVLLDVPPEFVLPEYKGIPITGEKVEIKDEEIEESRKNLLDRHARWDEVTDRAAQRGDLVQIDYEGLLDGKPIEDVVPSASGLGKGKDFWMLADENAFLPGFAEGVLGAKPGESREIVVKFPADFVEKSVAGKTCAYSADIKAIREKKHPELDQKLLESLGVDSEENLNGRIRDDMVKMRQEMENSRRKNEIVKYLLEKTTMDVPESVVAQETRDAVYDMVQRQGYQGISREQIEEKKEEIFAEANRSAQEKVKARYILHRIAGQEKIEATDEQVVERIRALAARYRVTPQEFRAELDKRGGAESVAEELRLGMTLDFLLEKAAIKE